MDVTPPEAAGRSSRPSEAEQPGGMALTLRRAGIALAGLGVAGLAAVACVLSFEDLRLLAVRGLARPHLAYLYPAGFDALLAVVLIGVLLLRGGHWAVRLQAGAALALLLAAAVAVEVAGALGVLMDARQAAVVVAVAPWVMLAVALWLWLVMIKHVQARRRAPGRTTGRRAARADDPEPDIVPFQPSERAPASPVRPPVPPERAPDMELRWGDIIRDRPRVRDQGDVLVHPRPAERPHAERHVAERVETWSTAEAQITEKDQDTQPMRAFSSERAGSRGTAGATAPQDADPAHGAEMADESETHHETPQEARHEGEAEAGAGAETTRSAGARTEADTEPDHTSRAAEDPRSRRDPQSQEAPPSGRMRSTPLPPEE